MSSSPGCVTLTTSLPTVQANDYSSKALSEGKSICLIFVFNCLSIMVPLPKRLFISLSEKKERERKNNFGIVFKCFVFSPRQLSCLPGARSLFCAKIRVFLPFPRFPLPLIMISLANRQFKQNPREEREIRELWVNLPLPLHFLLFSADSPPTPNCPTERFTLLELPNPSICLSELHKIIN